MSMTSIWREWAADMRSDAPGLPVEGPMLLHAAVILETAANTFDARNEEAMRRVFSKPPEAK